MIERGDQISASPAAAAVLAGPERLLRARTRLGTNVLIAAIAYAAVSQGAFHPAQLSSLQGFVLVAAALAVASRQPSLREVLSVPTVAALAVAATGLFAAAVSGATAGGVAAATVLVTLAAVVFVARSADDADRRALATGITAVGVAVALAGWTGVALHMRPLALTAHGLWRAASTVTYANGAAALLATTGMVALALVVATGRPSFLVASYVIVAGLAATMSRGGAIAFCMGVVVLAVIFGPGRVFRATWPVFPAAMLASVGLLPSLAEGSRAAPLPALLGLAAGGAFVAARAGGARRWSVIAFAGLAAGLVFIVATHGGPAAPLVSGRLSPASEDRLAEWSAALERVREHPLTGVGPGVYEASYRSADGSPVVSTFAHNEYLHTLVEQGLVGLAAVLAAIVALAVWMIRSRHRTQAWSWAAGVAGSAVILTHAALDFTWHIPLIPLVGAALLGLGTSERAGGNDA